jgi:putative transcriptional regulator
MTKAGNEILQGANNALEFLPGDKKSGRAHKIINSHIDVKSIRAQTGLSQVDFAETYGLSLHSLKKWETYSRRCSKSLFNGHIPKNQMLSVKLWKQQAFRTK